MPIQCICPQCGQAFQAYPSEIRKGRRFCSRACGYEGMPSARTDIVRFWAKVNKDGPTLPHVPDLGPCWVWTGARLVDGYGYMNSQKYGPLLAHRHSWTLSYGSPDDLSVLHRCDNPPCVRPSHLFLGTTQDNVTDMWMKGRARLNPPRGERHPFARLSETSVRTIRRLHGEGVSIARLAVQFSVSKGSIQDVLEDKTWQHVT